MSYAILIAAVVLLLVVWPITGLVHPEHLVGL